MRQQAVDCLLKTLEEKELSLKILPNLDPIFYSYKHEIYLDTVMDKGTLFLSEQKFSQLCAISDLAGKDYLEYEITMATQNEVACSIEAIHSDKLALLSKTKEMTSKASSDQQP